VRFFLTFAMALQFAAAAHAATVTFVSPLHGSQAIGVTPLEITTDAAQVDRVEFRVDDILAGVAFRAPYRVPHDFGASIAPHEIVADVYSNRYRSHDRVSIRTAALSVDQTINVDLVEVPIGVKWRGNEPRANDFEIKENGVRQTISELRKQRPPSRFVFVVDRSLSMGSGKLEAAIRAIENQLSALRAGDTAELTLFNHQVSEPQAIRAGARFDRDIVPSGGTSLRDAIASARGRGRTIVIAISDGGDRNSSLSRETALEKIGRQDLTLYAITLGDDNTDFLMRATTRTGGRLVRSSPDALDHDLAVILSDINGRYTLVYQSSNAAPGWRRIDATPRRRGVSIVTSRRGYFAE
jgi:von Willebrand factor type A domain.